jgi:hypothetical protein
MSQFPNKNPMADELFGLVQRPAGYAHISDGIDVLNEDQLLDLAIGSRDRHEECVKLLNTFILHHAKRIALKRPYVPQKKSA